MKQNKAPVLAALELIEKNLEFMNRHKNGNDFFMGLYDENEKAYADLQKWVDDVPDCAESIEYFDDDMDGDRTLQQWTQNNINYIQDAAKHLLKGIKNENI